MALPKNKGRARLEAAWTHRLSRLFIDKQVGGAMSASSAGCSETAGFMGDPVQRMVRTASIGRALRGHRMLLCSPPPLSLHLLMEVAWAAVILSLLQMKKLRPGH